MDDDEPTVLKVERNHMILYYGIKEIALISLPNMSLAVSHVIVPYVTPETKNFYYSTLYFFSSLYIYFPGKYRCDNISLLSLRHRFLFFKNCFVLFIQYV